MIEDRITDVEIDAEGRLRIRPAEQSLPHIWRAAMEVYWDPENRTLYSPKPREWTYPMWFGHILAAAETEYGVRLSVTSDTRWVNIPEKLQAEIVDPARWKGPTT